ncbi:hypothetical protein Gpo141_00004689 [Globisporangium polare]
MLRMQDLVNERYLSDADDAAEDETQAGESSPEPQPPLSPPPSASTASPPPLAPPDSCFQGDGDAESHEPKLSSGGERKRKSAADRTPFSHHAVEADHSNSETSSGKPSPARHASSSDERSRSGSSGALDPIDVRRRQQVKEASKRCRKRQKDESMEFLTEICTLHQKLALLHTKFDPSGIPSVEENRSAGHHRFRMKRLVAFLDKKLSDHRRWLQSVRSLMVASPLFDFAANLAQDGTDGSSTLIPDLKYLDHWREECEHEKYSRVLMTQRMEDVVRSSSKNATDLLTEFANQISRFQRCHVSRGWTISTTSNNALLGFHCERQLPIGMPVKDIAYRFWHSVQRDDILRTFIPVVQESTLAHESKAYSLTRRLLQRFANAHPQTVVTMESIAIIESSSAKTTNDEAWQISIEVVEDDYLCLLAAEKADEPAPLSPLSQGSIPSSQPTSVRQASSGAVGSQPPDNRLPSSSDSKTAGKFTIAIHVLQNVSGARIKLVGCAQHEGSEYHPDDGASLELLQYFVTMLPVYEELHLYQSGTL